MAALWFLMRLQVSNPSLKQYGARQIIRDRLDAVPVPIQIPIGRESNFKGFIDLVEQQAVIFTDDLGTKSDHTDVPTGMEAEYTQHREFLIERVAETDE